MEERIYRIGNWDIGNEIVIRDAQVLPRHARIVRRADGLQFIEELEPEAVVVVNGLRVRRKVFHPADEIFLGRLPFHVHRHFKVEGDTLLGLRIPDDFSEEFQSLRARYDQYVKDREAVERELRKKELLLDPLLAVPVAGIFLRNFARSFTSGKQKTLHMEKLQTIRYAFLEEYRCPNPVCRRSLGEIPWTTWAEQKSCDKCRAIWVT